MFRCSRLPFPKLFSSFCLHKSINKSDAYLGLQKTSNLLEIFFRNFELLPFSLPVKDTNYSMNAIIDRCHYAAVVCTFLVLQPWAKPTLWVFVLRQLKIRFAFTVANAWSLLAGGRKNFNGILFCGSLIRIPIDVCECMDAHKNSRQMIYVNCLQGLNRILNATSSE